MLYFIITTGTCNLKCKYCGGSLPEKHVPNRIKYEISQLKDFIEQDKEAIITFYGGEPLINYEFIREVMNRVESKKFVIQTNGLLYKNLSVDYWRRFDAVLLSIDGRKDVTDYYRGVGVYDKVVEAANWLIKKDYDGDLIARMAVSEKTDIYYDVMHLLSLEIFDHVHWQLDVGWSESWRDFNGWCEKSYKPGVEALVKFWIEEVNHGSVPGIVPFLGILKRSLYGGPNPPCGAGVEAFAIFPNGDVLACPIAYDAKWAVLGKLSNSPSELKRIRIECKNCNYFKVCGGRCLYIHKERLWSDKMKKVCDVTMFTIDLIEKNIKYIKNADRITYPNFNNSTEIIP